MLSPDQSNGIKRGTQTISVPTEKGKTMAENYISLERAIERMYKVTEECGTERIFIDRIIDELENLPSSPHICIHPQWIPVSEWLPENFVSVLGYMPASEPFPPVRECYTVGKSFFFPALDDIQMVTHWMPLPEPPKEDL